MGVVRDPAGATSHKNDGDNMSKIPFALRGTAAAATVLGLIAGAHAQQAPEEKKKADDNQLETVVVTGMRRSAESAQTIKQNSDQVVDSIVAEDIGKFPDKNVAEILGRVTGVQIQRNNGEASGVIVRGLGGVVTLLNGREFFSGLGPQPVPVRRAGDHAQAHRRLQDAGSLAARRRHRRRHRRAHQPPAGLQGRATGRVRPRRTPRQGQDQQPGHLRHGVQPLEDGPGRDGRADRPVLPARPVPR